MRGRVPARRAGCRTKGITPAYAGKREVSQLCFPVIKDHPRVCGEELIASKRETLCTGSPPRMRGRVGWSAERSGPEGITPAYAGKRRAPQGGGAQPWDHPRVCGEEPYIIAHTPDQDGSPPRMRGRVQHTAPAGHTPGITPAYAGKRLKKFHSIGHFSCILCLFHSVLHRASASGGSRAGPCAPPCLPAQNAIPV